ncbi:hypothetical protein GWK36_04360 [Caldichromatium japonicum]|uniref:NADH:quinone oxidoreductase/Mrp antiporter transmembrane domain-containing protein n=1 Tax=Caldichromatium japonicum TaxID=2699430 RepID=A0A6G7VBJ4_9GAMM|nr:proton-conducting transporter membrane subunit [Caldichromatium japonicum]QIK37344.1 hypothetical protein GWK36_04360 [Caldichromatium japonicum]
MPLHVWLPLAHPAAPIPASAVLSGAMIKAALLGWLRFLPLGALARPDWGLLLVLAGLLTTILAPLIGLTQTNPKVLLAYSSIAKMGLMGLGVGILLLEPELASTGVIALALYAAHHAFAKGGLFLGIGLCHQAGAQGLIMLGLVIFALAPVGAPLTRGALAKDGLKPLIATLDWPCLMMALLAAAIASALLMVRFLWLMRHTEPHPQQAWRLSAFAWTLLIGAVLLLPLVPGLNPGIKTDVFGHLVPLFIASALSLPLLKWYLLPPPTQAFVRTHPARGYLGAPVSCLSTLRLGLALAKAPPVGCECALAERLSDKTGRTLAGPPRQEDRRWMGSAPGGWSILADPTGRDRLGEQQR